MNMCRGLSLKIMILPITGYVAARVWKYLVTWGLVLQSASRSERPREAVLILVAPLLSLVESIWGLV